ncbi:hypothetical protein A33Q_3776 [Indibacter alkaliphilus LW1]|uniref:Uncharacterized protein n=1 Tax=Indibacter alkaliphilus (strain CCUG 57479 / KCTC 22604 / LW1) TaxID=1189612 RepID=S2DMN5_INDAL|nr:hypothetical protein A33Q_3776 [Indibacter alkaliphilus LW1]
MNGFRMPTKVDKIDLNLNWKSMFMEFYSVLEVLGIQN